MRRWLPWVILAVLAAGAWWVRRPGPVASLASSEVAYRARAVQLALAGGSSGRDRYLAHPAGAVVPFSPQSTAAVAALARLFREDGDARALETGGVQEAKLERLLLDLPAVGALLACVVAFLAIRRIDGCGAEAALTAAAVQAAVPAWLVAERAGEVVVEPLAAALAIGQFGLLTGVRRGRDLSDATLAGMLAGACGGLAVLVSSAALPLLALAVVALLVRVGSTPDQGRADAWRAFLLFSMAAIAVISIPPTGESTLTARLAMGAGTAGWWARALSPALALCAGLALRRGGRRGWSVHLAALGVAGALFFLGAPLRSAAASRGPASAELERGLAWMRTHTDSPGPFNHALAQQDWCALTAPGWGGTLAYHARRPVVAARFATATAPVDGALAALAETDTGALALALRELGVRYVVVSPPMVRASGSSPGTALHRLSFGEEAYPGLERIHASELLMDAEGRPSGAGGAGPFGPAFSIYRADLPPRPVPRASSIR